MTLWGNFTAFLPLVQLTRFISTCVEKISALTPQITALTGLVPRASGRMTIGRALPSFETVHFRLRREGYLAH